MPIEQAVPFVSWYKWVMAVVVIFTIYANYHLPTRLGRPSHWIYFLAACYPLGKMFQLFHMGFGPIRWYLSDFGFVPFLAIIVGEYVRRSYRGMYLSNKGYEYGVIASFIIAMMTEWMQLVGTQVGIVSATRGDMVDVMIFVTTSSLSMMWIDKANRNLSRHSNPTS